MSLQRCQVRRNSWRLLDPEVVDPDDIETLEDLIISAVNEALRAQEDDYNSSMGKISGGMGLGGLPF